MKKIQYVLLFVMAAVGWETAWAKRPVDPPAEPETATFENAAVTYSEVNGENWFTGIDDLSGLRADARATQDARGVWNVWTSFQEHLVVANYNTPPGGVTFSLPGKKRGSRQKFDLEGLTLFGYLLGNANAAGEPLDFTILAYRTGAGDEIPVAVPFSIYSLAVLDRDFSADERLKCLDHAVVQFSPNVGKTYFIDTVFTSVSSSSASCPTP